MKKALVLSLALVLGLGVASFAQTLSGSWETNIGIIPSPRRPDHRFGTHRHLRRERLDVHVDHDRLTRPAGSASRSRSAARSARSPSARRSCSTPRRSRLSRGKSPAACRWPACRSTARSPSTPGETTLEIVGAGSAGNVDVEVALTLGGLGECNFDFNGVIITIDFPFCCAEISSEIAFDCEGFQYVEFSTTGIALPGISWATLDAVLTFTVDDEDACRHAELRLWRRRVL